ncbi:MAG TPA: methylenetetrahydrofolate reductase [NAD(P)H] [Burkholderiaceae bacterium]|nr:methylenetetrahydrofolate reductase [NAD(P)H] [Burkholderiaceae bacterium]
MNPVERTFSFEFFPPKSEEAATKLRAARTRLAQVRPHFFSVTYGAGGSTREGTVNTVLEMHAAGLPVAPHISCIGSNEQSIRQLLQTYQQVGIRRLVALRGDLPSGMAAGSARFRYASDLVEFVRAETGRWFYIEVAAYPEVHPQARSATDDLANFVRKMRAGADSAITQYFFSVDAYLRFVQDARRAGIHQPIVPGVMPITNFAQLARFSDACGAEIPRWMRRRLESFGDDRESIRAFGLEVVTSLCERLLAQGAPGLHIYTMNLAEPTLAIWSSLRLAPTQ